MGGGQTPLPSSIQVSDVVALSSSFGVDPLYFLRVTSRADSAYLQEAARRAEKAAKRAAKKPR